MNINVTQGIQEVMPYLSLACPMVGMLASEETPLDVQLTLQDAIYACICTSTFEEGCQPAVRDMMSFVFLKIGGLPALLAAVQQQPVAESTGLLLAQYLITRGR